MKKVLVTIDFSDAADQVINWVADLVRAPDTQIHLMHVVEPSICYEVTGFLPDEVPYTTMDSEERKEIMDAAEKALHEYAEKLRAKTPLEVVEVLNDEYEVNEAILNYVEDKAMDFIVLGRHGRSFLASVLVGSVATYIVRNAKVPVMVVPVQSK